jgi:hypothetical protein
LSDKPSEEFIAAFCHSGSIVATCACGKTFFSGCSTYDYDDGEYEALVEKAKAQPDKYVEFDASHVSYIVLGGHQYVVDCDCGKLAAYEKFIWRWRDEIMEYMMKRMDSDYKLARLAHTKIHDLDRLARKNATIHLPP